MDNTAENKYPELLRDLVDKAAELLAEKYELPSARARAAGWDIAELIRKEWAGQNLYLAKGKEYELALRDLEMYRKFNGSNHFALAQEFGVTVRHVYRVIEQVRAADQAARQGGLFEE
jgi:Mor family transcriptional regulator